VVELTDPIDLARKLGVDLSGGLAPPTANGPAPTNHEPVDLSLYPAVRDELLDDSGDQSKDTYRVICMCVDCGLNLAQTRWVVDQRPAMAKRVAEFFARRPPVDDVLISWTKALGEWQRKQQQAQTPGPGPTVAAAAPGQATPPSPSRFFGKQGFRALDCALEVMRSVECGFGPLDERFYVYEGGVWTAGSGPIEAEIVALLGNRYRLSHTANAATIIKYQPGCARITDAPLADFINVPNGMIHWETGQLLPHHRDYLSTVQLPVVWQPDAKCPQFEKYLREVLPAELVDSGFIWELIGYTVFSGNPLHVAVLLFGKGRNGKGVFIRVLKNLLGEHNISTVSLHELTENKFRVATLYQKLANLAGDLDSKWLENTALFKKITGHDGIQGEYKYGASFEFDPWALPFYSANKAFGSPDSSEGWVARWVVVPFPNSFLGKEDRTLDAKLSSESELRGILAKAVAALPALMKRGNFADLTQLAQAKHDFVLASDAVRAWIDEHCVLDGAAWTPRDDLYKAYRWSTGGEGGKQLGKQQFYNRVEQVGGIAVIQRKGVRGFSGVQINASWGSGVFPGQTP